MSTLDEQTLRHLIAVGRELTSDLDLEVVLRRVLHTARELTKARYAALGILDESGERLERFHTAGIDDETRRRIGDLPLGRGVLGVLIRDPRPLRLDDVGEHPSSFGFPPAHPPMHSFLGVPIVVRGHAWGNLYLTEKEGGAPFSQDDEDAVLVLAEWAAVAIDNARLYTRAEGRRVELERAVRGLEATAAVMRSLAGETELERVLELVAKRGRAVVESRTLAVLLEDEGELRVAAVAGDHRDAEGARLPLQSLPGEVLRSGRSERVADVSARLRGSFAPLEVSARSALVTPLAFRGHGYGVLCALDRAKRGPEFDAEDLVLLEGFAAAASMAVATAQSAERELLRHSIQVQEHERRRWARELHDQTLQALGALQLLLSTALQQGRTEQAAADAIGLLDGEIDGLRAIINDLRPAALDELGTGPAIEALATRVAATTGMSVEASVALPARPSPDVENAIYRIVQEGLTNAAKHAQAKNVRVSVREDGAGIAIEVADDGAGFDPSGSSSGFGLLGMRERVALVGGSLEIDSEPGRGTTLRVLLSSAAERAAG